MMQTLTLLHDWLTRCLTSGPVITNINKSLLINFVLQYFPSVGQNIQISKKMGKNCPFFPCYDCSTPFHITIIVQVFESFQKFASSTLDMRVSQEGVIKTNFLSPFYAIYYIWYLLLYSNNICDCILIFYLIHHWILYQHLATKGKEVQEHKN